MSKEQGGQAFPIVFKHYAGEGNFQYENEPGMTLRDYFANSVLNGICLNESYIAAISTDKELPDELKPAKLAEICYELADAMIQERKK